MRLIRALVVFACLCLVVAFAPTASAKTLSIQPVQQQTYVWCWVAVGEMVFRHYGEPNVNPAGNYQCGIIGILAWGTYAHLCASDCTQCVVPAGNAQNFKRMFQEYPARTAAAGFGGTPLKVDTRRRFSYDDVKKAIDADRPVAIGISPGGRPSQFATSAHVAVIVGYRDSGGEKQVRVNDPYPYPPMMNPFAAAGASSPEPGAYWIEIGTLRTKLDWAETFVVRKSSDVPFDDLTSATIETPRTTTTSRASSSACTSRCNREASRCKQDVEPMDLCLADKQIGCIDECIAGGFGYECEALCSSYSLNNQRVWRGYCEEDRQIEIDDCNDDLQDCLDDCN